MPNLTGKTQDGRDRRDPERRSRPRRWATRCWPATAQKGTVVKQNPPPTTRLEQNGTVTIQICGGKPEVRVPAGLKGCKRESASARLDRGEAQVRASRRWTTRRAEDRCSSVDPPAGEQRRRGHQGDAQGLQGQRPRGAGRRRLDPGGGHRGSSERRLHGRRAERAEVPADQAGQVTDQSPNGKAEEADRHDGDHQGESAGAGDRPDAHRRRRRHADGHADHSRQRGRHRSAVPAPAEPAPED